MNTRITLSPTLPLAAAGTLALATLLMVAAARFGGLPAAGATADAPAVAARQLRFEDNADGGIAVLDGASGAEITSIAPGSNAFLRSAVRGLVRERKRQGIGSEPPFELTAHADGRLTLRDPGTGRRIDLEAFGASNAGAFARLLMSH